jgi:hypothetical protein
VRYSNVGEITFRQGPLRRLCGTGTIYLGTLTTGAGGPAGPFAALGFFNTAASGIAVRDILNPDAALARIRTLVEARQAGATNPA